MSLLDQRALDAAIDAAFETDAQQAVEPPYLLSQRQVDPLLDLAWQATRLVAQWHVVSTRWYSDSLLETQRVYLGFWARMTGLRR